MRVVLISETYSRKMGYLQNLLPKYLAKLGAEVHVVTMDLPPYYQLSSFIETYSRFNSQESLFPGTIEKLNGFSLHVLGHKKMLGYVRMIGLREKLKSIAPDIVQCSAAIGWIPLDAAISGITQPFKLFTGNHSTASTFPLARKGFGFWHWRRLRTLMLRALPGRLVSYRTEKCYAVTEDCAEIAWRFFGVERRKIEVMYLGVDTEFFFPVNSDQTRSERKHIRHQLGLEDDEIVCIYTGKLTELKNPLILARAVERLCLSGHKFRAIFIGDGTQRKAIEAHGSSKVLDFMPFNQVAPYYRASDIGVWPTDESTSTLDATACGLPLIVSDGIFYRAHVDGNGLVYKMNDERHLVSLLLELRDPRKRQQMGSVGAKKMQQNFSWLSVAQKRFRDYSAALA